MKWRDEPRAFGRKGRSTLTPDIELGGEMNQSLCQSRKQYTNVQDRTRWRDELRTFTRARRSTLTSEIELGEEMNLEPLPEQKEVH